MVPVRYVPPRQRMWTRPDVSSGVWSHVCIRQLHLIHDRNAHDGKLLKNSFSTSSSRSTSLLIIAGLLLISIFYSKSFTSWKSASAHCNWRAFHYPQLITPLSTKIVYWSLWWHQRLHDPRGFRVRIGRLIRLHCVIDPDINQMRQLSLS